MFRSAFILLAVLWSCFLSGCASVRSAGERASVAPLLLISMDAFRWDYCHHHPQQTPNLRALISSGVSAEGLIPVYPSNTFPNHYSIVTGLYPSHHGIVNNEFFDPMLGEYFRYNRVAITSQSRWWGGEPIWVTAELQGKRSAVSFWVGSEAEIHGIRPTYWRPFDPKLGFDQRLHEIEGWLAAEPSKRPDLFLVYLEEGNLVGHKSGPDSPEMVATLQQLDTRVGQLIGAFRSRGIEPNVVIVSDHGMTPISVDRVILLDEFVDAKRVQVDFDGPAAGLRVTDGNVGSVLQALDGLQHAKAYRASELPARLSVSANPRNPDIWIVPEEGWEIYFQAHFDQFRHKFNRGDHGYDPRFPSMHGVLIAHGPAFRNDGRVVPSAENVHLYNLLCAALRLTPATNDGDDRLTRAMLR